MNEDRLRWITRKPTLDAWEVTIDYLETPGEPMATVLVRARCKRKRGYLWTHTEIVPRSRSDYALHDFLCHIALVIDTEGPTTKQEFEAAMIGNVWEQPELPF